MPAASLCEALVEHVELGALLEAVRGLELKEDERANERRRYCVSRINADVIETRLQELVMI